MTTAGLWRTWSPREWGELAWVLAGQAASFVGGFAAVKILTNLCSIEQYGTIALLVTIYSLAQQILFGPYANAILRYCPEVETTGASLPAFEAVVRRGAFRKLAIGTCIVVISAMILLRGVKTLAMVSSGFVLVLFTVAGATQSYLEGFMGGLRARKGLALAQASSPWLRLVFAAACIWLWGGYGTIVLLGYALAVVIVVAFEFRWLRRRIGKIDANISKADGWRETLAAYARPFSIWGVFTWLQVSGDRWILEYSNSTEHVAYLAFITQIGYTPIVMFSSSVTHWVTPIVFARAGSEASGNGSSATIRASEMTSVYATIPCAILAILLYYTGRRVVSAVSTAEYLDIAPLLSVQVLSATIFCLAQSLTVSVLAVGHSKDLLAPKVCIAILSLVLSAAFGIPYGVAGIAVANGVTAVAYLAWAMYLTRRSRTR